MLKVSTPIEVGKPNSQFLPRNNPKPAQLHCSSCGSVADAACDCGVEYIPRGKVAAAALAEDPSKSNRAIAADIGVDESTVREARKSGAGYPAPAPHEAPDKRTGRDGKSYPAKPRELSRSGQLRRKTPVEEEMPTEAEAEESFQQTVYEMACDNVVDMSDATRRRFFIHLRRKYRDAAG